MDLLKFKMIITILQAFNINVLVKPFPAIWNFRDIFFNALRKKEYLKHCNYTNLLDIPFTS